MGNSKLYEVVASSDSTGLWIILHVFLNDGLFRKVKINCKRLFFVVFERSAILRKEKQINERQEFEQNALYLS
jgi:hypothetical protein